MKRRGWSPGGLAMFADNFKAVCEEANIQIPKEILDQIEWAKLARHIECVLLNDEWRFCIPTMEYLLSDEQVLKSVKTADDNPYLTDDEKTFCRRLLEKFGQYKRKRRSKKGDNDRPLVYLMHSSDGTYKIGHSINPQKRASIIRTGTAHKIDLICTIDTNEAWRLEAELHDKFAHRHIRREWFALEPDDVEYIKGLALGVA